jgi:hypothetical protein
MTDLVIEVPGGPLGCCSRVNVSLLARVVYAKHVVRAMCSDWDSVAVGLAGDVGYGHADRDGYPDPSG